MRPRANQVAGRVDDLPELNLARSPAPPGCRHQLIDILKAGEAAIPDLARQALLLVAGMIDGLSQQIRQIEIELMAWHRATAACRRLETIPGIGFITATALVATVGDAGIFRSGRQFAAWFGLVPKQHSSGGKERMGAISKMGDRYRKPARLVTVAVANKMARIAWAIMARNENYRSGPKIA